MYELYKVWSSKAHNSSVCYATYYKIFTETGLKFHRPNKHQCSLCVNAKENSENSSEYVRHMSEKTGARTAKAAAKELAEKTPKHITAACYDLQQLMYCPKSALAEFFYRRRLRCYNFTIYNLGTREGNCYFWHEGIANHGSCEIRETVIRHWPL